MWTMAGRECYQWIEEGEKHDCWTTTETALTQDLSGDLQDAWENKRIFSGFIRVVGDKSLLSTVKEGLST